MSFFNSLGKKLNEGVDRAKFEAERLQRIVLLQGEVGDMRRQVDAKRLEFGDRALDLYRAGKIQSPTLGEIMRAIEQLQASVTLKEEELKEAQATAYVEPAHSVPAPSAAAQSVPIDIEANTSPAALTIFCPSCGYEMPATAKFCPSCGARIGEQ